MPDLNDLTEAQLLDLMQNPEKIAEVVDGQKPEPTPEPEPPVVEDAPEPEPAAEPEKPEPEPEPEDHDRQALLAKIEELNARQRSQDAKLGKFAGEADFWRRKAQAEPRPEPESTYLEDPEPSPPAQDTRRDGTTEWVLGKAVETGLMQFAQQNPDTEQLSGEIGAYLRANGYGDGAIVSRAASPVEAEREAFRALSEAYWHVKAGKAEEARVAAETRSAEQFSRQKEAKQRASVSASGSTQAPPQKPKTLHDMSEKELLSEMDRLLSQR